MQNGNTVDLTGLRAFRVLRVLKGISVVPGNVMWTANSRQPLISNIIPIRCSCTITIIIILYDFIGLRTIVNAFIKSMKMLAEVMLLMLFCIAIFALLALQLYMGVLRQKCVLNIPDVYNFCNDTHPSNQSGACFNSAETYRKYWLQNPNNYLLDDEGEHVICQPNEGDR